MVSPIRKHLYPPPAGNSHVDNGLGRIVHKASRQLIAKASETAIVVLPTQTISRLLNSIILGRSPVSNQLSESEYEVKVLRKEVLFEIGVRDSSSIDRKKYLWKTTNKQVTKALAAIPPSKKNIPQGILHWNNVKKVFQISLKSGCNYFSYPGSLGKSGETINDFILRVRSETGVKLIKPGFFRRRAHFKYYAKAIIGINRGASKGLMPMGTFYWREFLDRQHRYGRWLNSYWVLWKESKTQLGFFQWLKKNNTGFVPQPSAISQIKYLKKEERRDYVAKLDRSNKISNHKEGVLYQGRYVVVVDEDRTIYVGKYKKGIFNHSSFLHGRPVYAAGLLDFENGILKCVQDKSGHYNKIGPQNDQNYLRDRKNILRLVNELEKFGVNLSEVIIMYDVSASPYGLETTNSYPEFRKLFPSS